MPSAAAGVLSGHQEERFPFKGIDGPAAAVNGTHTKIPAGYLQRKEACNLLNVHHGTLNLLYRSC